MRQPRQDQERTRAGEHRVCVQVWRCVRLPRENQEKGQSQGKTKNLKCVVCFIHQYSMELIFEDLPVDQFTLTS